MGAYYGNKIKTGQINPATEKSWTLNDVPDFWKDKTEAWLSE